MNSSVTSSRHIAACAALLMPFLARAQQASAPLTQGDDVIDVPGIGRVVFAFVFVAVLAVVAVMALKRVLPAFGKKFTAEGNLRVLEHASLGAGLRLQVVQVEGEKVLLAEGRHGIAMVVLSKNRDGSPI